MMKKTKNYHAWLVDDSSYSDRLLPVDKLLHFCKYGILAPSGHNTQPWQFKLQKDSVLIQINQKRTLPFSGDLAAEPYVSIGSLLETILIATRSFGYNLKIKNVMKNSDIYMISLGDKTDAYDDLRLAIKNRVSDRRRFISGQLDEGLISRVIENNLKHVKATVVTDKKDIAYLADRTAEATQIIMTEAKFRAELSQWVRNNKTKQYDGMPGSVQGMPTPPSLLAKHIVKNFDISKSQAKTDSKRVTNSAAIVLLGVDNESPEAFLELGRAYSRICIQAQANNLATSGIGAAVIDPDTKNSVREHFKLKGYPAALIRLGYSESKKPAPRTPRWPLKSLIVD